MLISTLQIKISFLSLCIDSLLKRSSCDCDMYFFLICISFWMMKISVHIYSCDTVQTPVHMWHCCWHPPASSAGVGTQGHCSASWQVTCVCEAHENRIDVYPQLNLKEHFVMREHDAHILLFIVRFDRSAARCPRCFLWLSELTW